MIIDLDPEDPTQALLKRADDASALHVARHQAPRTTPTHNTHPQQEPRQGVPRGATPPLSTSTAPLSKMQPPEAPTLQVTGGLAVGSVTQSMSLAAQHGMMIARVDASIRRKVARVVDGMMGAADVNPETGQFPTQWSDRKKQIAKDARLPRGEAPMYLEQAGKVFDSYRRSESVRPAPSPTLNADVRVYVRAEATFQYRSIDVTDQEK